MVPDWKNIGLFTAGIAVGAALGATVALLTAPASGGELRHRLGRRIRRGRGSETLWDQLASELDRAAAGVLEDSE